MMLGINAPKPLVKGEFAKACSQSCSRFDGCKGKLEGACNKRSLED